MWKPRRRPRAGQRRDCPTGPPSGAQHSACAGPQGMARAMNGTEREIWVACIGQSDYVYRHHEDPSSWSGGLASKLARAIIASPSVVLILGEHLQPRPFLSPPATRKRTYTPPPVVGRWPTAPSVDNVQFVSKPSRLRIVYSL
jgi:hypothetical protein